MKLPERHGEGQRARLVGRDSVDADRPHRRSLRRRARDQGIQRRRHRRQRPADGRRPLRVPSHDLEHERQSRRGSRAGTGAAGASAGLAGSRSRPQRRLLRSAFRASCSRPDRRSCPTRSICTRTAATPKAHLEIGFKFMPKDYKPMYRQALVALGNGVDIDIKGMTADQQLHAYAVLQENTKIVSFEPHLHAPGQRMCLEAIWGYNIQTLNCVGYDHNWVRGYTYQDDYAPLLPKGTILHIIGYMNNSPSQQERAGSAQLAGLGQPLGREHVHRPRPARLADRRTVPRGDGAPPHEAAPDAERQRHRLPAVHGHDARPARRRRPSNSSRTRRRPAVSQNGKQSAMTNETRRMASRRRPRSSRRWCWAAARRRAVAHLHQGPEHRARRTKAGSRTPTARSGSCSAT